MEILAWGRFATKGDRSVIARPQDSEMMAVFQQPGWADATVPNSDSAK